MNPGVVVTCSKCGARSLPAHSTGGRRWEDGGALIVSWTHGPYPRHDATSGPAPGLCLWCDDKRLGFPLPRPRSAAPIVNAPASVVNAPPPRVNARGQLALL